MIKLASCAPYGKRYACSLQHYPTQSLLGCGLGIITANRVTTTYKKNIGGVM